MASLEKRYVDVWQAKQFGLKANVKLFFDGAATYFGIDEIRHHGEARASRPHLVRGPVVLRRPHRRHRIFGSDVLALERLLVTMLPRLNWPHALLRGRFMKAAAAIEWNGTPIDTATLDLLRRHWIGVRDQLKAGVSAWSAGNGGWLSTTFRGQPWNSGRPDLSDDTFRQMARAYPVVAPMRELRSAPSEMRLADLRVKTPPPIGFAGPLEGVTLRGDRATAPVQRILPRKIQPCNAGAVGGKSGRLTDLRIKP